MKLLFRFVYVTFEFPYLYFCKNFVNGAACSFRYRKAHTVTLLNYKKSFAATLKISKQVIFMTCREVV